MGDKNNRAGAKRPRSLAPAVLAACLFLPAVAGASFQPSPELDVAPPVILVLPSEWSGEDQPVVLRARISDHSGVGAVKVWVMGEEDEDYRPYRMEKDRDGGYVAELPVWDGRGGALVYFVEAYDLLGNGPRRSAGPGNPFVLRAEEQDPAQLGPTTGNQRQIAVSLLLAPLALLWLMYRQDRGQRERRFWVDLLEPIADMRGAALARAIDGTCTRTVRHPTQGEVRLTRMEVRRWMRCLRESGELRQRRRPQRRSAPWRTRRPVEQGEDNVIWLPSSGERRAP